MRIRAEHLPYFALLIMPVLVAWLRTPLWMVVLLVLAVLMWRWALVIKVLLTGIDEPALVLSSMSMSHFVEKARWCLDLLEIEYVERADVGVMGVSFSGRTVPKLRFRSGIVVSEIGNSAEILRYLWGRYGALSQRAAFLEPSVEALELEEQLDRYGADLQRWVYSIVLPHTALCLRVWGFRDKATPIWQRALLPLVAPICQQMLRVAFRINSGSRKAAAERIEATLQTIENRLADGRPYLLGAQMSFVDVTFAALSGLWQTPEGYAGGRADGFRPQLEEMPKSMETERDEWRASYPRATALVERMYTDHRGRARG